jgi:hypothetical protein
VSTILGSHETKDCRSRTITLQYVNATLGIVVARSRPCQDIDCPDKLVAFPKASPLLLIKLLVASVAGGTC